MRYLLASILGLCLSFTVQAEPPKKGGCGASCQCGPTCQCDNGFPCQFHEVSVPGQSLVDAVANAAEAARPGRRLFRIFRPRARRGSEFYPAPRPALKRAPC